MTKEEAKNFPCVGPAQCGRTGERTTIRYCVGPWCKMAWRWIDAGTEWSGTYTDQPQPAGEGWEVQIKHGDRYGRWVRPKPPTDGYCGLAGKP